MISFAFSYWPFGRTMPYFISSGTEFNCIVMASRILSAGAFKKTSGPFADIEITFGTIRDRSRVVAVISLLVGNLLSSRIVRHCSVIREQSIISGRSGLFITSVFMASIRTPRDMWFCSPFASICLFTHSVTPAGPCISKTFRNSVRFNGPKPTVSITNRARSFATIGVTEFCLHSFSSAPSSNPGATTSVWSAL